LYLIYFYFTGATTYCVDFHADNNVRFSDDENSDEENDGLLDWDDDIDDEFE
jgi:hypothetical protein